MADLRVSELPVLLPADLEATDDLPVADYSSSETRRLTAKGLVEEGVSRLIDDGSIPGAKLVSDSVTALQIAPDAVGASELADDSVDTAAIQAAAVTNDKVAADTLTGDRLAADTVTTREIGPDAITASELADNSVDTAAVIDLAITNAKLADGIDGAKLQINSVTNIKLASGIDGGKLVADSVTAQEIAPDAVTASELADNSVDTAAIIDAAITNAKVATGTLTGDRFAADTLTTREIAPDAVTASELADDAVDTAAVQNAAITDAKLATGINGAKLTDGTVTDAKLAAGIDGSKLIAGSVGSTEIAPDSITATELADDSVDTAAVMDAAIIDDKLAAGIDGAKLANGTVTDAKLAGDIDGAKLTDATVTDAKLVGPIDGSKIAAGTLPPSSIGAVTDRGLDQSTGNIGHTNAITAGTRSGITFDVHGHVTSTTALVSSDLPAGTSSAIGGLSVPAGSGLTVNGAGALDHSASISAATTSGITYDEHGHITAATALQGTDLPIATDVTTGAVAVPGPILQVDGAGNVTHTNSPVTPGSYPKVAVNQAGHVTAGLALSATDIPYLDASQITTGQFGTGSIADKSITFPKLADYSISFIQEAQPSLTGNHIGALWYQESTAGLHMWNGNSWMPVSIGRLSQENLRYCGTIDATNGIITGVTQFGTSAGYTIGDPLKTASDSLTGTYFVIDVPGSGIPQTPGITYDNGDWVVCNGAAAGYVRIDTLNGGGGGGAQRLNDLLDVTLSNPVDGQMFVYTGAGQWINTDDVVGGTY